MSNLLLYVVTVLVWGSTWLAIEYQLGVVEPDVSIFYRYVIASSTLFLWCKYKRLSLVFNLKYHLWFAALGGFLFCLNYMLTYRAQVHITSALAAIIFSSMLWMNIGLARVIFGVRSTGRVIVGAIFGVTGIVVIFAPEVEAVTLHDGIFFGMVLALGGAFSASCGNMVSQGAQKRALPVVQSNAWSMFYGALFTGIVALVSGHEFNFDGTFTYIASLAYLAIFGSVIAFGAYLTLLGRIGAHKAGYATVMFPVVALMLSAVFEGLRLDASILGGTTLVLLGNLLVLTRSD